MLYSNGANSILRFEFWPDFCVMWPENRKVGPSDCADLFLITFHQSNHYGRDEKQFEILGGGATPAPLGGNWKIWPELLCGLMSDIIPSSFSSIGQIRRDQKQFDVFGGGAHPAEIEKFYPSDCANWCLVPSPQVSKRSVETIRREAKMWIVHRMSHWRTDGQADGG